MMSIQFSVAIDATIVTTFGTLLLIATRRAGASLRHALAFATLVAALVAPIVSQTFRAFPSLARRAAPLSAPSLRRTIAQTFANTIARADITRERAPLPIRDAKASSDAPPL